MQPENYIQTPYGIYSGVASVQTDENGHTQSIRLNERNVLLTHVGELIPAYGEDSHRRKHKASVSFHKNGMVNAVSLEEQQDILTPIGEFPAELVTFYDTGELKRIFPLDGKISGFWSEEDERTLHIPFSFSFDFSEFTALLSSLCFYRSGDIRSITLFPGEVISVRTPLGGEIRVRNGFSLYESGRLESVEPAVPTPVLTPIGLITAYDSDALGISADSNSLTFDEAGRLLRVTTSGNKIVAVQENGSTHFLAPLTVPSRLDPDATQTVPLRIAFNYGQNTVTITDDTPHVFSLDACTFQIYAGEIGGCLPSDCANCSMCSGAPKSAHERLSTLDK